MQIYRIVIKILHLKFTILIFLAILLIKIIKYHHLIILLLEPCQFLVLYKPIDVVLCIFLHLKIFFLYLFFLCWCLFYTYYCLFLLKINQLLSNTLSNIIFLLKIKLVKKNLILCFINRKEFSSNISIIFCSNYGI